jgi:hypothetical protein
MHDFWIGLIADMCFRVSFMREVLALHGWHNYDASGFGKLRHSTNRKTAQRDHMVKKLFIHSSYAR